MNTFVKNKLTNSCSLYISVTLWRNNCAKIRGTGEFKLLGGFKRHCNPGQGWDMRTVCFYTEWVTQYTLHILVLYVQYIIPRDASVRSWFFWPTFRLNILDESSHHNISASPQPDCLPPAHLHANSRIACPSAWLPEASLSANCQQ